MSALVVAMPAISDIGLQVMKRVIDENERTNTIQDPQGGPLPLAATLSDFFQLGAGLEQADALPGADAMTELCDYALDLVDRLSYQLRHLDIHDQRDNLSRLFVSLAVWFARRDATLSNLAGTADGFANLVNGESDQAELAALSGLMDEVLEAMSDDLKLDQDRSDPWRPWRVLNLNAGVAATRSLDTALMEATFDKLGRRLPYDMPAFFADGRRKMEGQNVPDAVRDVMDRYAKKWQEKPAH